jgi:Mitochondrial carrier protein
MVMFFHPRKRVVRWHLFYVLLPGALKYSDGSAVAANSGNRRHDMKYRGTAGAPAPASTSTSRSPSITQRLVAGGTSRALAQMVLYPIDALRTLAQTRDGRTLADVGASALVRGCATTSCFALLMGSIQFAVFGYCRSRGVSTILSSALGAAASGIVSVPQEVIKQRLVTGVYGSFRDAVQMIYKVDGISGYYSAWKPTMMRNVPFVMTTFTAMELLKRQRRKKRRINATEELSREYGDWNVQRSDCWTADPTDGYHQDPNDHASSVHCGAVHIRTGLLYYGREDGGIAYVVFGSQTTVHIHVHVVGTDIRTGRTIQSPMASATRAPHRFLQVTLRSRR